MFGCVALTKNVKQDSDEIANIIARFPDKIIGYAHIDPSVGKHATREIDRCVKLGFKGIKLHPHYDSYNVFDPDVIFPVMEKASKERLPVLIHTETPPMTTPIQVAYVAENFPDIPIICGHMGFGDSCTEAPVAGKIAENLVMDTTAAAVTLIIEKTVKVLGADRFVWGTDQLYLTFKSEFLKLWLYE